MERNEIWETTNTIILVRYFCSSYSVTVAKFDTRETHEMSFRVSAWKFFFFLLLTCTAPPDYGNSIKRP